MAVYTKLLGICIRTVALAFALTATVGANAAAVRNVTSTYESGAVFSGEVTFRDDFSNVIAVNGYLTGGPYGQMHIDWIWSPSYNFAGSFGPQYGGNLLTDGPLGAWTVFIIFTWDFMSSLDPIFATPGPVLGALGGNNINYADALVSGAITSVAVPVSLPDTISLFGVGLLGIAITLKKRCTLRSQAASRV